MTSALGTGEISELTFLAYSVVVSVWINNPPTTAPTRFMMGGIFGWGVIVHGTSTLSYKVKICAKDQCFLRHPADFDPESARLI